MKYRREKFTSVIQEAAGKYISEKSFDNAMITVTSVIVSKDLSRATVCISVIPEEKEEDINKKLNKGKGLFAKFIKANTRIFKIPYFSFKIDEGEKHRQKIDRISIKKNSL